MHFRRSLLRLPKPRTIIFSCAALYAIMSLVFLFFGRLNIDEGWYLYAGKLVYRGELPYRDFAFTQMPLLPYVYGLTQLIQPGLFVGRLTSFILSMATFVILVTTANHNTDKRGGAVTALLLTLFTYGIYFNTLVKTYALVALLFAITLAALTAQTSNQWKYFVAAVCAILACLARLSALAFAVPILLYTIILAKRSVVRGAILLAAVFIFFVCLILFNTNTEAATWNLITYHLSQWGDLTRGEKINEVLQTRIPSWISRYWSFALPAMLLITVALFSRRRKWTDDWHLLSANMSLWVYGLSVALFAASHFVTGGWHIEYFVPAIVGFMPLLGIAACRLYDDPSTPRLARRVMLWSLVVIPFIMWLSFDTSTLDLSGGQTPLEKVDEVAIFLTQHSSSTDRVMTLEALWTVVEAGRDVPPGLSMARFSLQDVDRQTAQLLHLTNCEMLVESMRGGEIRLVVLTPLDHEVLRSFACDHAVNKALAAQYSLVLEKNYFGRRSELVQVYLRRP